ncbi:MAG TPA: permease prefix domain 1-containing protein [Clostridia bacterium]|nr:permease prefix domain 1-containing protein [Clostridia bacterium]
METATPFDLNKAIQSWREKLASSPAVRAGDADELEMHLRDSITALEGKGLTAQEAFWVAKSRLGTHEALEVEFGKVNAEQVWIDRLLWMMTGAIVLGLGSSLTNGFVLLATAGAYTFTQEPVILGPFGLLLRLAVPALLLLCFWQSGRHQNGLVWRIGRRLKAAPKTTALIAFLLTFLASAIAAVGAQALSAKVMPSQTYSAFLLWHWPAVLAFTLLMPVILGWLLTRATRTSA